MEMRPLFVVGCPRSGTTMLQQALNRHPEIVIPPETALFRDVAWRRGARRRRALARIARDLEIEVADRPDPAALHAQIGRAYVARLGREAPVWFGEKTPDHLMCVRRIWEVLPDARVILLVRDGRDVAASLCRVPWAPDDVEVNMLIWTRFVWAGWEIALRTKVRVVRYEDLVADPEASLSALAEFLELEYVEAMAEGAGNREGVPEHELGWKADALEPIDDRRVARYRAEMDAAQLARLEALGGEALRSLGYECPTVPAASLGLLGRLAVRARLLRWRAGAPLRRRD